MKQLIRPVSIGGSSLVRAYLQEDPSALAFYAGSPHRLESYRSKLVEVTRRFDRTRREAAARALTPSSADARARLERFVEEGGAMVTTGQQAGFLTGPLYTVYKAVSAVVLARHLEEQLGCIVLPVFWVASDDHDWAEVNHAYLLDARNRVTRVGLPGEARGTRPMSHYELTGNLEMICDHASQIVAANGNNRSLVEGVVEPWRRGGATVAEAFRESIRSLLEPFDVCIADAADPALKETALPVLRGALTESTEHEAKLSARTAAIEEAGYHGQVAVLASGTNVFRFDGEARERLYVRGDDFTVRERRQRFGRADLLAELEADPTRFSPNVLLRPVVESTVFPTLAYVGGPGEIAYFAQIGALFEANDIAPPVVVPRFAGLVVEPKIEKLLASLGLTLDDVDRDRDQLVENLARESVPPEMAEALAKLREDVTGDFATLVERAGAIDPTLSGSLAATRNRALLLAARAERRILRAIKRSDRIDIDKLDRVLDSLRPLGEPQDRVLNVLPFLGRFGSHFMREVERTILTSWRLPGES